MGYSPQSLKESDRTERLTLPFPPMVTLRGIGRSTLLSWIRDLGPHSSLSPVSEKRLSFPLQGQPFTSDHFEKYAYLFGGIGILNTHCGIFCCGAWSL